MEILEIKDFLARNFNEIIDVRSPCEFASSHFVGRNLQISDSIESKKSLDLIKPQIVRNFAVLSDKEREEVGTLYRQNPFSARLLGAAAVCKNISEFMPLLAEFITPARSFGLYCARGGMRSRSLGVVLENIGYRPVLLKGGYKSYRAFVSAALRSSKFLAPMKFLTLNGASGCGKSEIIRAFNGGFSLDSIESSKEDLNKISSLDIENLADHLGSSFGGIFKEQKSQKSFENALFARLCELGADLNFQNTIKNSDSIKIILCENESKKLGNIVLPSELFKAYQNAPKIEITAPLQERIERTCELYGQIDESFFNTAMQKIAPFMQKAAHQEAKAAFARRDLEKCAEILLLNYYDKVYRKSPSVRILEYKRANLNAICEEILEITKEIYNI